MLGMFNLLPLLKGWEWHTDLEDFAWQGTLERGGDVKEIEIEGIGWLAELFYGGTDSEINLELWSRPGKGQKVRRVGSWVPQWYEAAYENQPNLGYASNFMKTSPTSTAGYYAIVAWAGWATGSVLPFLDNTKIKLWLPDTSTQTSCLAAVNYPCVLIKSIEKFIQSLRAIQGTRNMEIPAELIEFSERYLK